MELTTVQQRLSRIDGEKLPAIGKMACNFLETAGTAAPRATFYNTRDETVRAVVELHGEFFNVDRGLYGAILNLPGMLDWHRQLGIATLLGRPNTNGGPSLLTLEQENEAISHMLSLMPYHRRLKLFGLLRQMKVNNTRTRRLILTEVLSDESLPWHAVKYRKKLATALRHVFGRRRASIIRKILDKAPSRRTEKDCSILRQERVDDLTSAQEQCIRFILGSRKVSQAKLKAYVKADEDFEALAELPPEVAEGKRSTFHKDRSTADVLEATKSQATAVQQVRGKRAAEKRGVKTKFDPTKQNPVHLYVYMLETGDRKPEYTNALLEKAQSAAGNFPLSWENSVVIIDTSKSMIGGKNQKYRPLAAAYAVADLIWAVSKECIFLQSVVPDHEAALNSEILQPEGDTPLGRMLVNALKHEPDAIFAVTDGYENAPAGRFAEVLAKAREIGIGTPVYQLTPTFGAEVYGTRDLSEDVPVLPIGEQPSTLGLGFAKMALEADFYRGVQALLKMTKVPLLAGRENDDG